MSANVNVVVITGNLTQDPELRSTGGGTSVCEMRVAVDGRRKDQNGRWVDQPNYFNVVAFGAQGDNCATYLVKGRPVAIQGRLDWREWEDKEGGGKRQAVQIIAESVQFLGYRDKAEGEGRPTEDHKAPETDLPPDGVNSPVTTGAGEEEDIPF